ncbi:MAG: spore cortex biosynthesis protein YabQ [Clostridium perfringens]|nr:spore cortex biosynthesis protein YabQ [Clostridium perfringens]
MLLPLRIQFDMIIYPFISGFIIGLFFDIYRIIRGKERIKIISILEDVLFWILCGLSIFIFLLKFNYGFLNVYVYVFILIGIFIYFSALSKKLLKLERFLIQRILKTIRVIFKNLIYILKSIFTK